jgi:hypothetical protein
MRRLKVYAPALTALMGLAAVTAGCGDNDPGMAGTAAMGGSPPTVMTPATAPAPTVSAVSPRSQAVSVPINDAVVSAAFNEPMAAIEGPASFTLTCDAPCISPTGTLIRDASNTIAGYTLAAGASLAPLTLYTATVTGASSLAADLALASPYSWQFTTGITADTTRPSVSATVPVTTVPGPTASVATNGAVSAVFTEDMSAATITGASFTVTCTAPCVSPAGTVAYSLGSRSATFTPVAALAADTLYAATITATATDLAGNALAGNQAALPAASSYVWTFTTGAGAAAAAQLTVLSTNPAAAKTAVCPNAPINASFGVPSGLQLDPGSVNALSFTVAGPAPAKTQIVAASVTLDAATGRIATFTPQSPLSAGDVYSVRILGGAGGIKDQAIPPDDMAADFTWSFTAGAASAQCTAPAALRSAAPYGTFGGSAGMTNSGIVTVVNGDIGTIATTTSSITGFDDTAGDIYTESPVNIGKVNGTIYSCTNSTTGSDAAAADPVACSVATQARLDAQSAYLDLAGLPAGANPGGNLGGLVLAPGVYTSASGSFEIQGSDLTLDAQGNADAVWVFQMASTLTVGGPGAAAPQSVILAGGAQSKNVFWQVGSAATINAGGGGTMVGSIISQAGAAFSTVGNTSIVTLNGRVLSLNASVTLVDTVINVPAP